jgi:uncharacterized protein (TIGR03437 family)
VLQEELQVKPALLLLLLALSALQSGAAPTIGSILNNYSYTVPTSPNYGIAQGAIFTIFGTELANTPTGLQGLPLATSLQGVTVTATVNGVTRQAYLYYVTAGQIAGILPSAIPVGTGTITVNNNGQTSLPFPLKVVASAFGTLTLNGSGLGSAAVYDASYQFLSATNSARPSDIIQLFGTGVGATTNNESIEQVQTNLTGIPMTATVGGVAAEILYRGRTIYPGLDQINIRIPTLPAGTYGCSVSLVITTGAIASNTTTIPVMPNGGNCSSAPSGGGNSNPTPTQTEVDGWIAAGVFRTGSVGLLRTTGYTNRDVAGAVVTNVSRTESFTGGFNRLSGPGLAETLRSRLVKIEAGACTVVTTQVLPNYTIAPLNAGAALRAEGPNGTRTAPLFQPGIYVDNITGTYIAPGRYTFSGTGGTDVGAFTGTVDVSPELLFTNTDAVKTVTRAEGVTVHWTGGDPARLITITGQSTVSATNFATFLCFENQSAGRFTVPASVLNQMPASPVAANGAVTRGSLTIYSYFDNRIAIPGLDLATASGEWLITVTMQYK